VISNHGAGQHVTVSVAAGVLAFEIWVFFAGSSLPS
jgi:hypothetical protein